MIKIASYCRVSTDKEDQANSFETQKRYFCEYIQNESKWELYKIYADEGVTGTSTKKRVEFNRMLNEAYEGKFQLIITKEVSRFSRNILDTIRYTRELRNIGIGVIFLNDRINTLNPEAEMLLSLHASLAQEESRRTSSRVTWGQMRQMEKGVVFGRSLLGYDVKNGVLRINEEGAEIVRTIFHKYAVEQVSTTEIARYLTHNGCHTSRGRMNWNANTVLKILNNEKYVGDLVQKKTYTPDFLSHEKRINKGEVPFITIKNHHEAIISREVWQLAIERRQKNNKHCISNGGYSNRYIFSGKIKCGECGSSFVGRFKYLKDGTKIRRWSCSTATCKGVTACDVGKIIRDDDAMQMLKMAIRNLAMDFESIINSVATVALHAIQMGNNSMKDETQRLKAKIDGIQLKKETMMDSFFDGEIDRHEMLSMKSKYDREVEVLQKQLQNALQLNKEYLDNNLHFMITTEISGILNGETECETFYKTVLDTLTVYKDRHIELHLKKLPQVFYFF